MKCQIIFSRNNKKNITYLSSAEPANSMISVNMEHDLLWNLKLLEYDLIPEIQILAAVVSGTD